jgi:membrane protein YdbS with pleckstrin-like domain
MQVKILKPSSKYLIKMRLVITLIAALVLLVGLVISVSIALDRSAGAGGAVLAIVLIAALDAIFWVVAILLVGFYYRSLSYEIQDDEVIVRAGIWTQSVKHVPYRTVTNLKVKRDILDRWLFGLGTLNIQTAGMSGTTGAEESLVGLVNVEEVYDTVATELRRFRGSMAPTAAEVEGDRVVTTPDALGEILTEVRAIRQALEER